MKRKFLWIAALLAALVLIGCGGSNADEPVVTDPDFKWYLTDTEGGDPIPDNKVTITQKTNIYVYFDAPGASFDKIKITYTCEPGQNLTYASLYDRFGEGEEEEIHTWGISPWVTDWKGGSEEIVAEIDPSNYGDKWSHGTQDSRSGIDRTKIFGLCINFNDVNSNVVFTLKNVVLTGKGTPPPPPITPLNVTAATLFTGTTATIVQSDLVSLVNDGSDKAIKILPTTTNENKDNFKIKITFDPPVSCATVSNLVFEWKTTPAASTLAIGAGIRSNSGYTWLINESGISSPGTLDFVTDVPNWAGGWGDTVVGQTCSEIEFEFTDSALGEYTELYLKKIGFSGSRTPNGGGEEIAADWYITDSEDGSAITSHSITGSANNWYGYIYFNNLPSNISEVTGVKLTFTTTAGTPIKQGVYDSTGSWGWGWGDVTSGGKFTFSGATGWGATGSAFDITSLKGICLKFPSAGTFTLSDVVFVK